MQIILRRFFLFLLILSFYSPGLVAADETNESNGSPIDVMGKVLDHDYIEVAGKKIYLPRIFLAGGQFYFYANTESALASGDFIVENERILCQYRKRPGFRGFYR